ncbi:hypothetical protein ACFFSY_23350 [Paenibacillus aurantiacus]|uniref:Uncharacterized protein n=1 Tax=Paenibacillus aurantiacus TaxID=1936118 RepID=A0ABV5KXU0_9BACL
MRAKKSLAAVDRSQASYPFVIRSGVSRKQEYEHRLGLPLFAFVMDETVI